MMICEDCGDEKNCEICAPRNKRPTDIKRLGAAIAAFKVAMDNTPQDKSLEDRAEIALKALPLVVVEHLDSAARTFIELTDARRAV